MKKIRKSVFETNSSAMHSIIISNDKEFNYKIFPKKKMKIKGKGIDFYTDPENYYDLATKIEYIFNILDIMDDRGWPYYIERCIENFENKTNNKLVSQSDMKDKLMQYLNSKNIIFIEPKEYGYLDIHNYKNLLSFLYWLFSSNEHLDAYLFNSKSHIHTDDLDSKYWDEFEKIDTNQYTCFTN